MSHTTAALDDVFRERDDLFLLGLAHRHCEAKARDSLQRQEVELPPELPQLRVDEPDDVPPPLHEPPSGDTCPFCGSAERVTEEHVWPKWVTRVLRDVSTEPFKITTGGRTRSAQMLNVTAPICRECNTRWLSTLENDVRPILAPMIVGQPQRLMAAEQEKLAAWAAKTALMIDLAHRGQSIIPEGFYRDLRLRRSALPSHTVIISNYGGNWAAWAQGQTLRADPSDDSSRPVGFVITFTVFRVVFQVMGHFTAGSMEVNEGRWQYAPCIERIWPIWKMPVQWPKSHYGLYDKSLEEFAGSVNVVVPEPTSTPDVN